MSVYQSMIAEILRGMGVKADPAEVEARMRRELGTHADCLDSLSTAEFRIEVYSAIRRMDPETQGAKPYRLRTDRDATRAARIALAADMLAQATGDAWPDSLVQVLTSAGYDTNVPQPDIADATHTRIVHYRSLDGHICAIEESLGHGAELRYVVVDLGPETA